MTPIGITSTIVSATARALSDETRAALLEAVGPAHLKVRLIDELIARIGPAEQTAPQ